MPLTDPLHAAGAALPAPPADAVRFVLRLGHALHSHGYAAHQLEETLRQVAGSLGLTAQFFSAPTSILAAFGPEEDQRTHLLRVEPGEVDLGTLARLHAITGRVLAGRLTPLEGAAHIRNLATAPVRYPAWITLLAYGLASAGATRFLGGGWREIAVSGVIGLTIGVLAAGVRRVQGAPRVFEPAAALLASALAALAAWAVPPLFVYLTTLGGLIVLIPGLTLTVALTELSTGNLQSGTARLFGATVVFLAIAFGVALGGEIVAGLLGDPPAAAAPMLPPAWTTLAALIVVPAAFTVLFRAEPRDFGWILAVGMLGYTGNRIGAVALSAQLGVLLGALSVGAASNLYARALRRPAAVTQVPGILLLVPGSVGFRSLASMLDHEVLLGVETAFAMALTAMALVAGLLVANLVVPVRPAPARA